MKKIFEDWRSFLLERKIDPIYDKIADYFYDLLLNHEKYFYSYRTSIWDFFALSIWNRTITKEEFARYQAMTGDDVVIPNETIFYKVMTKFTVKATHPDVHGVARRNADMSDDGVMRIFVRKRPDSISSFVKNIKKGIFKHEIAHWLNSIRSGFKTWRSKGRKNFRSKEERYANSTEEMQARLSDVFYHLKNRMSYDTSDMTTATSQVAYYFQGPVNEKDPKLFIERALEFYGRKLYFGWLNEENKKRVIKRLYEMYNHFVDEKSSQEKSD